MDFCFIRCLLLLLSVDLSSTLFVHSSPYKGTACLGGMSICVPLADCKVAKYSSKSKTRTRINPKICGWASNSQLPLVCCQGKQEEPTAAPNKMLRGQPTEQPKVDIVQPTDDGQVSYLSQLGCGMRPTEQTSAFEGVGMSNDSAFVTEARIYPEKSNREVSDAPEEYDPDSVISGADDAPDEDNRFAGLGEGGGFSVGGTASTQRWPWMVAIFEGDSNFCGGTLIDDRHIITAAHCFGENSVDPSLYKVKIGDLNLFENIMTFDVADIRQHEGYRESYYYDDIAIMTLSSPLIGYTPACLPAQDDMQHGDNVTTLGWGELTYGGVSPSELQEVVGIPIVETSQCNAKYRKLGAAVFPRGITDKFLCAGLEEGGKDACRGDSGGPLLYEHAKDHWTLVGVVSFGLRCAEPGYPGVYTKVAAYIPWIEKNIKGNKPKQMTHEKSRRARFHSVHLNPRWWRTLTGNEPNEVIQGRARRARFLSTDWNPGWWRTITGKEPNEVIQGRPRRARFHAADWNPGWWKTLA